MNATSTVATDVSSVFSTLREMLADRGFDVTSLGSISNDEVAALARVRSRNDDIFSVDLPSCSTRIIFNLKQRFSMGDIKKLLLMPTTGSAGAPAAGKRRGAAAVAAVAAAAAAAAAVAAATNDEDGGDDDGDDEDAGNAAGPVPTFVAGGEGQAEFVPTQFIVVARQRPAQGKTVDDPSRNVQLFLVGELMYNITKHELQPRFLPIRDEAAIQEIMKRYRLKTKYQFPLILSSDVIARYYALKPGQLVQITCRSPSAGTYTKYRCCS